MNEGTQSRLTSEVTAARADPRRRLGPYLVLSELGRGGMGVVYRAWDDRLRRVVALKLLLDEATEEARRRFQREAEAVARLRHPAIVAIHEVGQANGRPYLAMELVEGATLERRLEGADRLPLTKALELVRDVARAVEHAHSQGVVHRDLKPQNVLVDEAGRPHVLDFGLATIADDASGRITKTSATLGTPAYMAPEQVGGSGVEIGPRADVYALGAILYRVLVGRPPFEGASDVNVIVSVMNRDPVPPGDLNPRARGDLETIALRCLEKEPERRYGSAEEVALELDRWLRGDPIVARPLGLLARVARRVRRHKVVTVLGLALAGALGAGGALLVREVARRRAAEELVHEQRRRDEERAVRVELEARNRALVGVILAQAERALDEGRSREAATLAAKGLSLGPEHQERLRAVAMAARAGPWRRPRVLRGHTATVTGVALAPAGDRVYSASTDGTVRIWDLATGSTVATLQGHEGAVTALALSADGDTLATAGRDRSIRLWDGAGRSLRVLERAHERTVSALAFEPGGRRLLSGSLDGTAKTWDHAAGRALATVTKHADCVRAVAFGPRDLIATASDDCTLRVFGVPVRGAFEVTVGTPIETVAFTGDGRQVVFGYGDGWIRAVDIASGRDVEALRQHTGRIRDVAVETTWIASAADEGIRLWSPIERQVVPLVAHVGPVYDLAFDRDVQRLASAGDDRTVAIWDLSSDPDLAPLEMATPDTAVAFGFLRGGEALALGMMGSVRRWDVGTRRLASAFASGDRKDAHFVGALAPERLVVAGREAVVTLWDPASGVKLGASPIGAGGVTSLGISRDGQRIAVASARGLDDFVTDATVSVRGADLTELASFATARGFVYDLAVAGDLVAAANDDGTVALHDVPGRGTVALLEGHRASVVALALTEDGKRLASASLDRTVRLWDLEARRELAKLSLPADPRSLAFDPRGRRLAVAGRDGRASLWLLEPEPRLVACFRAHHGGGVERVAFTPSGDALATAGYEGLVRIWPLARILEPAWADSIVGKTEEATGLRVDDEGALVPRD